MKDHKGTFAPNCWSVHSPSTRNLISMMTTFSNICRIQMFDFINAAHPYIASYRTAKHRQISKVIYVQELNIIIIPFKSRRMRRCHGNRKFLHN